MLLWLANDGVYDDHPTFPSEHARDTYTHTQGALHVNIEQTVYTVDASHRHKHILPPPPPPHHTHTLSLTTTTVTLIRSA